MIQTPQVALSDLPNAHHAQTWLDDVTAARGGAASKPLTYFINLAAMKARQYEELGVAYVDLQPGNGTAYMTVLHDLTREQINATLRSRAAADGPDAVPLTVAQCREYVTRAGIGPSARLGGELLVALPENRGGVSAVFSVEDAFHLPYYVDDRLRLGPGDAPYFAAFLTLFCDAVTLLRRAA